MSEEIQFLQSVPGDIRDWALIEGGNRDGSLVWQEKGTGRKVRVPNVWYNQTVETRVAAMEFYIERTREAAAKIESDPFIGEPDKLSLVKRHKRKIRGMRKLIREMRRQGKPLA